MLFLRFQKDFLLRENKILCFLLEDWHKQWRDLLYFNCFKSLEMFKSFILYTQLIIHSEDWLLLNLKIVYKLEKRLSVKDGVNYNKKWKFNNCRTSILQGLETLDAFLLKICHSKSTKKFYNPFSQDAAKQKESRLLMMIQEFVKDLPILNSLIQELLI